MPSLAEPACLLYGFARTTADLDVLSIVSNQDRRDLAALAGQGSEIHKKHKAYLDVVTTATHPDSHESRLTEMFPGTFHHLRLLALDPKEMSLGLVDGIVAAVAERRKIYRVLTTDRRHFSTVRVGRRFTQALELVC